MATNNHRAECFLIALSCNAPHRISSTECASYSSRWRRRNTGDEIRDADDSTVCLKIDAASATIMHSYTHIVFSTGSTPSFCILPVSAVLFAA